MKVQVCRNCGNRNTVISRALTSCNYCGSEDLEPVTDTSDGKVVNTSSSVKWLVLLMLLLLVGGIGWLLIPLSSIDWGFKESREPLLVNPVANNATKTVTKGSIDSQQMESKNVEQTKGIVPKRVEPQVVGDTSAELAKKPALSTAQIQEIMMSDSKEVALGQSSEVKKMNQLEFSDNKLAAEVVDDLKIQHKPLTKPQESIIEPSTNVTQAAKVAVAKPRVSPVAEPVVKPVSQPNIPASDDAQTIADLKLKLAEYKKQNAQKTEQKLTKETRLSMRVLDRQKGIVTDAKTGLMWMACTIGQKWQSGHCVGSAEEYLWTEAADIAKDSEYAGYHDWRLPTREELNSIVYCSNGRMGYQLGGDGKILMKDGKPQNGKCLGSFHKPTIDVRVFPNTPGGSYWSYSRNAQATYNAWAVFFDAGYQYSYNTSNLGLVRLVRSSR
ncbi:MAG: DUF1566 domain-containing protein [Thiomicrorhabdus sp.]|nr:DUF1566 domain-containing protein [Thiomicrorhabdus sp.]